MTVARVAAQAKINLRLKVLCKEHTGFHSLETVFLRLELADQLSVGITDGRTFQLSGPDALVRSSGPNERNLAVLAADAYAKRAGWPGGYTMALEKRIPVGAGLGGGSADAAAVLRALNALAATPLPPAEILRLADSLGSDVPFMAGDHAMALAWGRGERLLGSSPLPTRPVIIATPPFGIETKEAYGWLGLSAGAPVAEIGLLPEDAFASWESAATFAENDLEPVVARRHPVCARMKASLLERGARLAMLCGSGSSVFGIFDEHVDVGASESGEWSEIVTRTATHVVPVERMD